MPAAAPRVSGLARLKRRAAVTFAGALLGGAFLAAPPLSITTSAATLSIAVQGNHFVNGSGQTVRLLGVDRSGSEYMCTGGGGSTFDGPFDDASIAAIAAWHTNAVRVPLNEDCWLGINGLPNGQTAASYQAAIVDFVNRLHAKGQYVILDLHWNNGGTAQATGQQGMADADHAPALWTSVANTFKSDPAVLFDLYNEPHGVTWDCWKNGGCTDPVGGFTVAGMQTLLNAVRATGATQPVMAGGLGWSGDLSQWLSFMPSDPGHALVASFHTYNFSGCDVTCWTNTVQPVAATVPVVTGELGENDCAHGYIDSYMTWADTHGVSYLGWAWNTYDCGSFPSLIIDYTGTPTAFGAGLQAHLAALAGGPPPLSVTSSPSVTSGVIPLAVNFTGSASGGTPPYSFAWNFGDTATSSSQNPSHTYTAAGTYPVTLTVADSAGAHSSAAPITIAAQPAGPPPLSATSSPSVTSGVAPLTVNFTGSASGGTAPYTFAWSFGDGATSSSQNPSHTYMTAGAYSASLTVTDATGAQASGAAITITVSPATVVGIPLSLGGLIMSGPTAAAANANRVDVFAVGGDRALWQKTWNGSAWGTWTSLGGAITADPGAVAPSGSRIDVFARGMDNAVWHRYWNGTSWSGWDGLGGGIYYGPEASSWSAQRLDLFVIGLDHQLWHKYWDGVTWSSWEPLGGYLTSGAKAVSWGANRIDIVARGGDNQYWHLDWTGTAWSGWQPLGGLFQSGPSVASCASGHLDVFGIGLDGQVWRKGWNGTAWGTWEPLGGLWTSDPAAVCVPGGITIDLFGRGGDNALWLETVNGS